MENIEKNVLQLFDERLRSELNDVDLHDAEEIRLRSLRKGEVVTSGGYITLNISPTVKEITSTIQRAMRYSLYANENALKSGRITVNGGHRVSFAVRAVIIGDIIGSMDSFGSVCVRIARQSPGCSENLMPHISNKNGQVNSTLIISPTGVGKTTALRDIARNISSGIYAKKTVIIDERGEIASSSGGINYLDVGQRSDVLSLYDKNTGINMAIRSLSPEVIITDEIGSSEDSSILSEAVRCGVKVIASAHSDNIKSFMGRKATAEIVESKVFDRYIFIQRTGNVISPKAVYDRNLNEVLR